MVRGQKRPISESESETNLGIITSKRSRITYSGSSGCSSSGSSSSGEYDGDDDTDTAFFQLGQSRIKPVEILRLDRSTVARLRGNADMSQSQLRQHGINPSNHSGLPAATLTLLNYWRLHQTQRLSASPNLSIVKTIVLDCLQARCGTIVVGLPWLSARIAVSSLQPLD